MKIAILTPVFLGGFGGYAHLRGDLIGGAEVYLHSLIRNVLEPIASRIVVYQKMGISKMFSEKTSVITMPHLNSSKLKDFDLVVINGLQFMVPGINNQKLKIDLQFVVPRINNQKTNSIAIHHGMTLSLVQTLGILRMYYEYHEAFPFSAKRFYDPTQLLFGEKIASLSLKLLKLPFYVRGNTRQRKLAIAAVNRNSDIVNCVVSVDKDSLRYVHPPKRAKWKVIYNFVDLDLFNTSIPRQDSFDGRTILVPRNLTTGRGVFIVPRLACLLKKWKYRHFRFLITGEGRLRPFLENEIKRLKLEKEVILIGHQDHFRDMPRLYADSDIILVPSFYGEGTSLAVLEGMASKKPVVTTDVGGINDIGVNEQHKLSSSFDIESIRRNIARLMDDENLMKRIAEAGYEYVCRNHNIYLWIKKWREVIESYGEI